MRSRASLASLLAVGATASIIDPGTGFDTYHYDDKRTNVGGIDSTLQNKGYVECSCLHDGPLLLDMMTTNFVMAMNHTLLKSDPFKNYGKRVLVTFDGNTSAYPFHQRRLRALRK